MKTKLIIALALVFVQIPFSTNVCAQTLNDQGVFVRRIIQNVELSPQTSMTFTLSNPAGRSTDVAVPATCGTIDGFVDFTGTTDSSALPPENSTSGLNVSPQKKKLQLLDRVPFSLAEGESVSLEYLQPFSETQNFLVTVNVPPRSKHCLSPSITTVRDITGKPIHYLPSSGGGIELSDFFFFTGDEIP